MSLVTSFWMDLSALSSGSGGNNNIIVNATEAVQSAEERKLQASIRRLRERRQAPRPSTKLLPTTTSSDESE